MRSMYSPFPVLRLFIKRGNVIRSAALCNLGAPVRAGDCQPLTGHVWPAHREHESCLSCDLYIANCSPLITLCDPQHCKRAGHIELLVQKLQKARQNEYSRIQALSVNFQRCFLANSFRWLAGDRRGLHGVVGLPAAQFPLRISNYCG